MQLSNLGSFEIILCVLALLVFKHLLDCYCRNRNNSVETFENAGNSENAGNAGNAGNAVVANNSVPAASSNSNSEYGNLGASNSIQQENVANGSPRDQLSPEELLPSDANSQWAQISPNGQGQLMDGNFLEAGYHIGVNTVGQSLRNANRQLRSEPPNPQIKVSPWSQTTIESDSNRRALEIGNSA